MNGCFIFHYTHPTEILPLPFHSSLQKILFFFQCSIHIFPFIGPHLKLHWQGNVVLYYFSLFFVEHRSWNQFYLPTPIAPTPWILLPPRLSTHSSTSFLQKLKAPVWTTFENLLFKGCVVYRAQYMQRHYPPYTTLD